METAHLQCLQPVLAARDLVKVKDFVRFTSRRASLALGSRLLLLEKMADAAFAYQQSSSGSEVVAGGKRHTTYLGDRYP